VKANAANIEIRVRQRDDRAAWAVIISSRGREAIIELSDYDKAMKWAEMECRSYKVLPAFSVEADVTSTSARRARTKPARDYDLSTS
jgi:hypothetical protein